MISKSQDFFLQTHSPATDTRFVLFFLGRGRPISLALNTGLLGALFRSRSIRACLAPYRRSRYGLFVALSAKPIRAPGGYCPLGNTPPSRGCATLTPGCILAPLQGARCSNDRKPGVALRLPRAVFWRPFRASIPHRQICHICRRQMFIPHRQICHICRRQMSIPLAKFVTSAVGRCPFPIAKLSHLP